MLRKLAFWSAGIFLSFVSAVAIADLAVIDGLGAPKTIKNFVCETTKLCNATVLIKSDGTEIGTVSAPVRTDPIGTTAQPVSGTVTANIGTAGTLALAANQTNASQKTQIVDGSGNVIASTSNNLNVQCANCSGSGVSTADAAAFTPSTSLFAGTGGFFQTTATSNPLTNGQQGMWQMTANRAGFVNLRNASGAELGVAAAPVQVSLANTAANATAVKVDGSAVTQPVSGTVTTTPPSNASSNVAQINGITPLMGNGVTGTGSQRVTIASDNTAFSVNAIQSGAWTVNPTTAANWGINTLGSTTSGQSGELALGAVTTAAPTYTTATSNALSLTTAGALRVDGSGVTQPVSGTVTTSPPSNASSNIAQINGVTPLMGNGVTGTGSQRVTIASDNTAFSVNAASTLAAETTKVIGTVRNLGNAGAITDFAGQNAASPANSWLMGAQFNTSPTTLTSGNASPLQLDSAANLLVNIKAGTVAATQSGTWTVQPGNTANTTPWLMAGNVSNASSAVATGSTDIPTNAYNYGFNGTTWDQLQVDASKFLKVNCAAGCTGASDTVANLSGMTANSAATQIALVGTNSVAVLLSGTWTATLTPEVSADGGTTWVATQFYNVNTHAAVATVSANGTYDIVGTGGKSHARVRISAFTSGTVTGNLRATSQAPSANDAEILLNSTANASTPAGSNIIGKVGIDQTTPGTTNLVALAANQSVNVAQWGGVSTSTGQVAVSVAPVTATNTALVTALRPDSPGIIANASAGTPNTTTVLSVQGVTGMTPVVANSTNGYPSGATAITASATGTTAATTATLAGTAAKTTYICGFAMRSVATAAAAGNATVTGTITGTLNFTHGTGATPTVIPNDQRFNPCVPASATNTGIAVVSPAAGTGGVMSVTAWGFQL